MPGAISFQRAIAQLTPAAIATPVPSGEMVTGAPVGAVVHEAKPGDAEHAKVLIIRDGMRREFEFRKDQPSILDAASAQLLEEVGTRHLSYCGSSTLGNKALNEPVYGQ